jgi:signal transduction histidine kinase
MLPMDDRTKWGSELERRRRQQEAVGDLSREALSGLPPSELMQRTLVALNELMGGERSAVFELDPGAQSLDLRVWEGAWPEHLDHARVPVRPGSDMRFILGSEDAVVVGDLLADPRFASTALLTEGGFRGAVSARIGPAENPYGVLAVYRREQRPFRKDDGPFLSILANILADAIARYRAEVALRESRERLRQLSLSQLQVQERERRHIASELHDEVGQSLTALKINLHSVRGLVRDREARSLLDDSIGIVTGLVEQIRDISLLLRPSILDDFGLVPALRWCVNRYAKRVETHITFDVEGSVRRLSADVETVCFRIAQEALTNVLRHARASRARVRLQVDDAQLHLSVVDDGVGFEPKRLEAQTSGGRRVGLAGMRERGALVGGEVEILSAPGHGTQVRFNMALASDARAIESVPTRAIDG